MKIKKPAIKTSLKKCPPSKILVAPNRHPKHTAIQKNILIFVIKNNAIIEKPTDESPDTKEQFVLQESDK